MKPVALISQLQDEAVLRWSRLEDEREPCIVLSNTMELVYVNGAARALVPSGNWFGKRCFDMLPVADTGCAFHCPTMTAVSETRSIVYGEETVCGGDHDCTTFGFGLIPIRDVDQGPARSVLLMRRKTELPADRDFERRLLEDARRLALKLGIRD